jgi:hypothetical protein
MFERQKSYTRAYISQILGGGVQDYLPHADGKVTYGAFAKDLNPEAPSIVPPGMGEEIERWAHVLFEQKGQIPVFIKKRSNEWTYMGDYRCVGLSEDASDIAVHAKKTGRDDITMVLRLERVRDSVATAASV